MNLIDHEDELTGEFAPASSEVVAALEDYQEAMRGGRSFDRAAFLLEHAHVADQVQEFLDALELIQSVAGAMAPEGASTENQNALEPGEILGDFRILHEVGRGGMGVVYEAEQVSFPERRVALKVIASASALDTPTLQRFRVETQAAACLNHPNIVPVFAVGCERGIPYYAMPLVKGHSLAEMLKQRRDEGSTMTQPPARRRDASPSTDSWPVIVAGLGLQAALALEHAHSLGIIHRDIKPSNLLVDDSGRLLVTDFGLARITRDDREITRTGDLVGTLRYISPENVRGEPGGGDVRADIYSLGATLYESLTLRPLFGPCDRAALLQRILHEEPARPRAIDPSVPTDLETIVLKSLDKVASGRYASATELAEDLRRFLDDRPVLARRPNIFERSARWSRKHRGLVATAFAGFVLCMAIGTVFSWRAKQQAEDNLAAVRAIHHRERTAVDGAFSINEVITIPLIEEATRAGVWSTEERRDAYRLLIGFYDQSVQSFSAGGSQSEVAAKAARRSGALRMALGDPAGAQRFVRAIEIYERLAAKLPKAVWYRTGLIATLCEYAVNAESKGDQKTADACRNHARTIAEGLVTDPDSKLHCFRSQVAEEFKTLIDIPGAGQNATAADRAFKDRLRKWLADNP